MAEPNETIHLDSFETRERGEQPHARAACGQRVHRHQLSRSTEDVECERCRRTRLYHLVDEDWEAA